MIIYQKRYGNVKEMKREGKGKSTKSTDFEFSGKSRTQIDLSRRIFDGFQKFQKKSTLLFCG